ncbi:type 2 lanthipeptide synthetase LanM family protein [Pontibacillus litoralis]|uniref:Lantibiotic biosynthesis protein dehydration domain-containing protein n=1 Tax=Pontibacillus litoralis JSM 072002 TaxID=1385512 RepID=A0A0A5HN70_9BACI|nr:type 2 lanthipeptide synthetase LanM family protein [Pontibacillus litoralis]KGX85052.1 hypothetical protein N784_11190 [Pontibacillus litoralis JSM 072002]
MITTDIKSENLMRATYLNERLSSPNDRDLGRSYQLGEEWLKKSGLPLGAFEERLKNKGFSYDQFLFLLENKNSPSIINLEWQETLFNIINEIDSKTLKSNIETSDIGVFVLPFTNYFMKNLHDEFSLKESKHINFNSFINSCEKYLFHELKQISDKTVVLEFHKLKENLRKEKCDLKYFKEVYLSNIQYIKDILFNYPVIARILTEITERTILNVKNLINRYLNDYQDIVDTFFNKDIVLHSASFGLGDSHNNGQTVAMLKFENDEQLVYKPRSLSIDVNFNQFLNWINQSGLSLELKNGKSLSRSNYGWQQFIQPVECKNREEIHEYYYRMGANIAIFHLLRSNDMHYENIIASGSVPYVIDLETLFSNSIYSNKVLEFPRKELLKTVLSSGILPTGQVFNSTIDFDASAIAGKPNQTSESMTGWVMVEDVNGEYKYENTRFVTSNESHLVKFNNEIVKPETYIKDIEKGFMEVYHVFLRSKETLYEKVIEFFGCAECRVVLRPTFMYSRFLIASHHPTYLQNGLDREELMEMLWNIKKSEGRFEVIVESEIQDLLNNDIPYFTYGVNSKHLMDSRGQEIKEVFDQTSLEMVKEQITNLSKKDLYEQLKLIRLSIETNAIGGKEVNETECMKSHHSLEKNNTHKTLLETSEEIGDFLVEQAIYDTEGNHVSWAGVENIDNKFAFKMLDFSLYNGTLGMTIFLGQLYQYIPKESYKEVIYKNINYLRDMMQKIDGVMTNSMFNGIGSFSYSLYYLSSVLNDSKLSEMGHEYLMQMKDLKTDEVHKKDRLGVVQPGNQIDFLDGHAGIITFAINLFEMNGEEDALDIAKKYGQDLMEILKEREDNSFLLGLAHGTSGIVLALDKLGRLINDPEMQTMVKELVNYEDKHFDVEKLNWLDLRENVTEKTKSFYWCHGAPGILLSRAQLEQTTVRKEILETEVINQSISNYITMDPIGLCHGVLGNLDILLSISAKYPEDIKKHKIKQLAEGMMKKEENLYKIQGMKDRGLMGLMLGVAGVGYSLLRINDPSKVPSVLKLELPHVRVKQ